MTPIIDVIDEISGERLRQERAEGWTEAHDDQHTGGEMAIAAAGYAYMASVSNFDREKVKREGAPYRWPWSSQWWKPTNRRRDLIKAAALIVAEIERLDRQKAAEQ